MAAFLPRLNSHILFKAINQCAKACQHSYSSPTLYFRRHLQGSAQSSIAPDFAFAFDVDGVLVRSNDPIPRAHETLSYLQHQRIPFILLTNGGGKHESERVADLTEKLKVPLNVNMFIQSHTPFADLDEYKNKTILVVGGDKDKCRLVAERYGFKAVITPGDILVAHPTIWPFSQPFLDYYRSFARPLSSPIDPSNPSSSLKIDGIFVYNDPRDWGLDATIILDLLLSEKGIMGTVSPKNNDPNLPNRGYLQDDQPTLFYSNGDLWWAASYHLSRLGQGGFREAFEGLWTAVTGGERMGVDLKKEMAGKPFYKTYEFAEKRLREHREQMFDASSANELRRVYMVGDNPDSDIRGANTFNSPFGTEWQSILVRTGVHKTGDPSWKPKAIVNDVYDAVQWALEQSHWKRIDQ